MTRDEALPAGHEALQLGHWEEARERLLAAIAHEDLPEAHDGLGKALWWLGEVRGSLTHQERAYAGYRGDGRHAEAAMVALDISVTYLSNLDDPVVARGWIARARRAAEVSGDPGVSAWLWLMEGYTHDDPERGRALMTRTLSWARESGDTDLELATLADLGLAMVTGGEVAQGFRLLDEALAGTLGGECERLDLVVWTSCSMLAACSLVGDQQRAAQWCGAAERFAARYGCPFLQARCRSHYGRVLVAAGDWQLAETELARALSMSTDCGREPRIEALAGLAELRLRQGSVQEASRLLAEVDDRPDTALVAAELQTAQGYPERAVAVLAAHIGAMSGAETRFPIIVAALVEAHLAGGDADSAATALESLRRLPRGQHPQVEAVTERANGLVALARGDTASAVRHLRRAVAEFDRLGLPFEAATTRLQLARGQVGTDAPLAIVEAGRALASLDRLGAARAAAEVAALLRELGVATRPGPRQLGALSVREREVLALLPRGLTNPQIATELFISPKTVAHHVSRILTKLDLSTRAEAAAFAATRGAAGAPD